MPPFPGGERTGEPRRPAGACCAAGGRRRPQLSCGLGWVRFVPPVDLLHDASCTGADWASADATDGAALPWTRSARRRRLLGASLPGGKGSSAASLAGWRGKGQVGLGVAPFRGEEQDSRRPGLGGGLSDR
jgi:hypothetical protein